MEKKIEKNCFTSLLLNHSLPAARMERGEMLRLSCTYALSVFMFSRLKLTKNEKKFFFTVEASALDRAVEAGNEGSGKELEKRKDGKYHPRSILFSGPPQVKNN